MKRWDVREQECMCDHGWSLDRDEKIILTKDQFDRYPYSGRCTTDSSVKTLMLPSANGCCLIFEHKHFLVQ